MPTSVCPSISLTTLGAPLGRAQRGQRMPQVVEADPWQPGSLQQRVEVPAQEVLRGDGPPDGVGEHQIEVVPDRPRRCRSAAWRAWWVTNARTASSSTAWWYSPCLRPNMSGSLVLLVSTNLWRFVMKRGVTLQSRGSGESGRCCHIVQPWSQAMCGISHLDRSLDQRRLSRARWLRFPSRRSCWKSCRLDREDVPLLGHAFKGVDPPILEADT
jgi:hypothetical protein